MLWLLGAILVTGANLVMGATLVPGAIVMGAALVMGSIPVPVATFPSNGDYPRNGCPHVVGDDVMTSLFFMQ